MPMASFRDAGVSHGLEIHRKFPKNRFPDCEVRDAEERKHQV